MQPHEALNQIHDIRQHLAGATTYRGFRSAAVAASGVFAFMAAGIQSVWVPEPTRQLDAFLGLWLVVALASMTIAGAAMVARIRRTGSRWERDLAVRAVECVAPALVLGAGVTAVLVDAAPRQAWLLPGLWAAFLSLGAFAARRMLSPMVAAVAGWYAVMCLICISFGGGEQALRPWTMGVTFGVGQIFAAGVLFWTVERGHDET